MGLPLPQSVSSEPVLREQPCPGQAPASLGIPAAGRGGAGCLTPGCLGGHRLRCAAAPCIRRGRSPPAPALWDPSGQSLSLLAVSKSHRCRWSGGSEAGSWRPVPGSTENQTTEVLPRLPPPLNNGRCTCSHAHRHIYTYLYSNPPLVQTPALHREALEAERRRREVPAGDALTSRAAA